MEEFVNQMRVKVKQMYGEKPTGSDDMGKMINTFHTQRMQNILKTAGGEVKMGGKVILESKYVEPTLILEPNKDAEIMTDEIFGPILPVFKFKNFSEVINFLNDRPKPLATYYMGNHKSAQVDRLMKETSSGALVTNDCMFQLTSHYQGFGGVGASGYGRYSGFEGFKNFSNRKGILIKGPAPKFLNAMVQPPYSEVEKGRLRMFGGYMTVT
jgi:aldehyde dehydrogenase (NAD+)